jgi:hypothetical protein
MNPSPGEVETDPRFPSGKWAGFWTQTVPIHGRLKQEMILTFHRGEIDGEGRDMVGKFHIRGFYSTEDGKCRWTKRYVGRHDVFYQGFNEGKGIWGTWEIPPTEATLQLKGGFHIWPEGMADPTGSALSAHAETPIVD